MFRLFDNGADHVDEAVVADLGDVVVSAIELLEDGKARVRACRPCDRGPADGSACQRNRLVLGLGGPGEELVLGDLE